MVHSNPNNDPTQKQSRPSDASKNLASGTRIASTGPGGTVYEKNFPAGTTLKGGSLKDRLSKIPEAFEGQINIYSDETGTSGGEAYTKILDRFGQDIDSKVERGSTEWYGLAETNLQAWHDGEVAAGTITKATNYVQMVERYNKRTKATSASRGHGKSIDSAKSEMKKTAKSWWKVW